MSDDTSKVDGGGRSGPPPLTLLTPAVWLLSEVEREWVWLCTDPNAEGALPRPAIFGLEGTDPGGSIACDGR